MPRPAATTGADGLPLWDTFEALFFLIAGLSIGVVLGVMFPSLWRSFRRRFRNPSRFAPHDASLSAYVSHTPPLHILSASESEEDAEVAPSGQVGLAEAFVIARHHLQEGRPRESVRIYLDILGHEQVSTQQTNRALFELSQVYAELGLQSRALDTGLELLHRKPDDGRVFTYLLDLCTRYGILDRVKGLLSIRKGRIDEGLSTLR